MYNRYRNILPHEDTRVKIAHGAEDYINANHISVPIGDAHPLNLIMAQGPLPSTSESFLEMALEQQTPVIVMLTREVESGTLKCHAYWPKVAGQSETFGDITVTNLDVAQYPEFTASLLRISNTKTGHVSSLYYVLYLHLCLTQAHVTAHLQCFGWDDHKAPDSQSSTLRLLKEIVGLTGDSTHPVILHCSAGVGRSGTLAALLSLRKRLLLPTRALEQIAHAAKFDYEVCISCNGFPVLTIFQDFSIREIVKTMRAARCESVVQTPVC